MTTAKVTADTVEGFVKALLLPSFDDASSSPECHKEWWEMFCSDNKFVAIAAPRGHAKSTALTISWVLAQICFRARSYVVIVSDTEAQSILFLNIIKKELIDNEDLRAMFGIKVIDLWEKDTERDIIIDFIDGHQCRVVAKGSGQRVRGFLWGKDKKRPDLLMIDDLEDDEAVSNKDRREKLKKWVNSALLPMRAKYGIVRAVGTILHMDSWLSNLMPKESDRKNTVVTPLKTYSLNRASTWYSALYRAHPSIDLFEPTLWPSRNTPQDMREIRDSYVSQGLADLYSQEYLNNPIDESNAQFRRGDFLPLTERDKEEAVNYYIGVDLAVTKDSESDFTAFVIGGVTADHTLQIRHVIRERMDSLEIVDMFFELQRLYDPMAFGIEKGAIINSIMPLLERRMNETGIYLTIEKMHAGTDKVQRSKTISARCRSGKVKVDTEAPWYEQFMEDLLRFPRGVVDDTVDAFAWLGRLLNKMVEAPTPEEQEEEDYDEEFSRSGMHLQGRSAVTGY